MKSKKRLSVILCAAFLACFGIGGAVYALWTANTSIPSNSVGTPDTVNLTTLSGSAFAVNNLVPYDQPAGIVGARVVSQGYTVALGDDFTGTYDLEIADLVNTGSLAVYYKVTATAVSTPPANTTGWTALAAGDLVDATALTANGTHFLNLILVSTDTADANKTVTFTVNLVVNAA